MKGGLVFIDIGFITCYVSAIILVISIA